MFNQKELAIIMGALVHESLGTKKALYEGGYTGEEEQKHLETRSTELDILIGKTQEIFNGI